MQSKRFFINAIIFVSLVSCTNDTESDLLDNKIPATITYTNSIKSIMDTNCISCHGAIPSNGAPMPITTYQNTKNAVLNLGLIERISKTQGSSGMMPYGGTRISQSSIDQVIAWKNNGFSQ